MQRIVAGALALLTGAVLADRAASTTPESQQPTLEAAARPSRDQKSMKEETAGRWIRVTSAEQLVGQDLRSKDGRTVGQIDAIMLNLTQGEALFAMVKSAGDLDIGEDRLAVPFAALQLTEWTNAGPISVNQTFEAIKKGERTSSDRLLDFGSPERVIKIFGAYGIPTPYGYLVPPEPGRQTFPNRFLLVRPERLTFLATDNTLAQEIRGQEVQRSNGDPVGEIDQIMIETANGRIAYVLLSAGGFLGIGSDWIPVPAQALAWSLSKDRFVLEDNVQPEAMQALHKTKLPTRVQRAQLETLYDRFNVKSR